MSKNVKIALRYARMTGGDAQWALVELKRRQDRRFNARVSAAVAETMYAAFYWN